MSVQESAAEAWVGGTAAGLGALSVAVHAWDNLKEVTLIFITSTIVWPQVNSREGTQLHPSTGNWIKDLLSMAQNNHDDVTTHLEPDVLQCEVGLRKHH